MRTRCEGYAAGGFPRLTEAASCVPVARGPRQAASRGRARPYPADPSQRVRAARPPGPDGGRILRTRPNRYAPNGFPSLVEAVPCVPLATGPHKTAY